MPDEHFTDEEQDDLVLEFMLNTGASPWTMSEIAHGLEGDEAAARRAVARLIGLGLADRCEDLVFPSLTVRHALEVDIEQIDLLRLRIQQEPIPPPD